MALRRQLTPDKYGALGTARQERERLVAAFQREDALQSENDRLRGLYAKGYAAALHQRGVPASVERFRVSIGWNETHNEWVGLVYDLNDHGPDLPYATIRGSIEWVTSQAVHYVNVAAEDNPALEGKHD